MRSRLTSRKGVRQVLQIRRATVNWPVHLKPLMTRRVMGRVTSATVKKYAAAVLPFCNFVTEHDLFGGIETLEGAVGLFLPQVRDQDLRMLSGGMKHFFPFVGKTRISADLKGLERACSLYCRMGPAFTIPAY